MCDENSATQMALAQFSKGDRLDMAQLRSGTSEVVVYARLPRSFQIPTPVGNYAPDWAIAFDKDKVRHVFFIAETKGTMDDMQLSEIENNKIKCAKKLFNDVSTQSVKYALVDNFEELRNVIGVKG